MPEQKSHSSYQIIFLAEDQYSFVAGDQILASGTLAKLFTVMVMKYGFQADEIEAAVLELQKQGHTIAEFGVFKSFMFTMNPERKAS